MDTYRVTLALPKSVKGVIEELAERMNQTDVASYLYLLKIGMVVESVALSGGRVVIEQDGERKILADNYGTYLKRDLKLGW